VAVTNFKVTAICKLLSRRGLVTEDMNCNVTDCNELIQTGNTETFP
jgi:hypothetical protein